MKYTSALLAAVAAGSLIAPCAGQAATAPARHHHARHRATAANAGANENSSLLQEEVAQLRAEVNSLHQDLAAEKQAAVATQNQMAETQAQVTIMHAQVPAAAKAAADSEIAVAIDKEHHSDRSYYRGITVKPVGFIEAAGIFRQHFQGSDIGSSFSIPFPNAGGAFPVTEQRFTARQSRVGFLAEGQVNKETKLSMYGEFDFLGAAQTANNNQSNSYTPRVRHLYGTIDWNKGDTGLHLLAGQTWSLATMNTKGISPRNELIPVVPEASYVPGFVYTRQPGVRLTADFLDHTLWLAVSAENPATLKAQGSIPATIVGSATNGLIAPGSGFNSANNLSMNGTPDFIGKVAYEGMIAGRSLHLEGFGISRTFTAATTAGGKINRAGYGFGGGIALQAIPNVLDLEFTGISGKGIGRYAASTLSDITFDSNGGIHPVKETALLAGAIVHATKMLDVYGYAGEELESNADLIGNLGTYTNGFSGGNNSGCFTYGTGTCNSATRRIRQVTAGFWQKIYSGSYGHAQVGIQYSYTQRELFADTNGITPQVGENMGFLSFRYYPFN